MKEGVDTALYLYEGAVYGTVIKNSIGTSLTYTADKDILIICTIIINSTCNSLIADNIQIEKSTVATEYEPHKEQTVYFPLAEGQKLMEGSYLAEDGVHNKRKQVVLDGTKNWSDKYYETYPEIKVYLNDLRVDKKQLQLGDILFISGLKIIWMRQLSKHILMDLFIQCLIESAIFQN